MAERTMHLTKNTTDEDYDEHRLIEDVRKDPRKFGLLYKKYANPVYRYIFTRTGNKQITEDITSQTFLSALESFSKFRQDGNFGSWLFTIARNKVNDHFRRSKILTPIHEAELIADGSDALATSIQSEQSKIVQSLIKELTEDEQELLRLRFIAELSFANIARLLHKSEDAVKKSTYRLLARLQSQVEVNNE
jgi:RNA polymerase sigma-70 factor (ECF subfamily)